MLTVTWILCVPSQKGWAQDNFAQACRGDVACGREGAVGQKQRKLLRRRAARRCRGREWRRDPLGELTRGTLPPGGVSVKVVELLEVVEVEEQQGERGIDEQQTGQLHVGAQESVAVGDPCERVGHGALGEGAVGDPLAGERIAQGGVGAQERVDVAVLASGERVVDEGLLEGCFGG